MEVALMVAGRSKMVGAASKSESGSLPYAIRFGLFPGDKMTPEHPHHVTAESFAMSVENGCFICNFILLKMGYDNVKQLRKESEARNFSTGMQCGVIYTLDMPRIDINIHHRNGFKDSVGFFMIPQDTIQSASFLANQPQSSDNDDRLFYAKNWLDNCTNHHICMSKVQNGFYPTRLIEILEPLSDGAKQWSVIESEKKSLSGPYTTLSHRWGGTNVLKLTQATSKTLFQKCSTVILPKTFRQALDVAACLGFRYMWIDSLCIVQDSEADWQYESLQMHNIYRQSALTIAAGWAQDSEGGLYATRSSLNCPGNLVRLNWKRKFREIKGMKPQRRQTKDRLYHVALSDYWNLSLYGSGVSKRGWVFQELMLSPRILYFGKHEIYWDCFSLKASENFPMGLLHQMKNSTSPTIADTFRGMATGSLEDLYKIWRQMVVSYSACSLSFEKDRLVAFAGVAKAFHTLWPDDYYAGIWKRSLDRDLLWYTRNEKETVGMFNEQANRLQSLRPEKYRAPSWSWAAVNGAIMMDYEDESFENIPLLSVKEIKTDLLSGDPFGQITGGFLKLECWLLLAKSSIPQQGGTLGQYPMLQIFQRNDNHSVYIDSHLDDKNADFLFLPVRFQEFYSKKGPWQSLAGLLLRPLVNQEPWCFTRAGLLTMMNTEFHTVGLTMDSRSPSVHPLDSMNWPLLTTGTYQITIF